MTITLNLDGPVAKHVLNIKIRFEGSISVINSNITYYFESLNIFFENKSKGRNTLPTINCLDERRENKKIRYSPRMIQEKINSIESSQNRSIKPKQPLNPIDNPRNHYNAINTSKKLTNQM